MKVFDCPTRRSWWLLPVVIFFFLSASPVFSESGGEPVRIGVIVAQTGPAAVWGKYARMGAELAVEEINSGKLVQGAPRLQLLIEDGRTEPAAGVSAFQKLTAQQGAKAIFGDVWAFLTQPLIPLANRSKVVLVSPTVAPESVQNTGEWFFSLGAEVQNSKEAVRNFFRMKSNLKRVAIFCWDDPWGDAVRNLWREEIAAHGMTIVKEVCVRDFQYDYRTDVTKVLAEKPELILISYHADRILKLLRERHATAEILSTEMIEENLLDGSLPWDTAQGAFAWSRRPTEEFRHRFQARYGEEPKYLTQNSYDAIRALAEALRVRGSNELAAAMRELAFDGASGPIDMRSSHWGNRSKAELFQVRGRELVLSRP